MAQSTRYRLMLIAILALMPAVVVAIWSAVESVGDVRTDSDRRCILSAGLASTSSLLLAWYLHHRLFGVGLSRLLQASRRMASGDLSARAGVSGGGTEVAYLADSFDHMAQQVQEREQLLRKLNRELQAISQCHHTLIRAADEPTLIHQICQIICHVAGYRFAWVGYVDQEEAKTVRPIAWGGFEDGYLANARITWDDAPTGQGPTGACIRLGETQQASDWEKDPTTLPWRSEGLRRGYRSSIAMPLRDAGGTPFGALSIYGGQPNAFTAEEVRLLEDLAADLAFGIVGIRVRVQRDRAERGYSQVFEATNEAMCIQDTSGTILDVNEGACGMYGIARDAAIGRNVEEFSDGLPPYSLAEIRRNCELAANCGPQIFEWRCKRADGSRFWGEVALRFAEIGGQPRLIAATRDITDRKEAQSALLREQRFSQALLSGLPGIFYLYTYPELRLVRFNANHESLLGYAPGEIMNRSLFDWHPPENRDAVRRAVDAVMQRGINTIETPLLTKNGISIPFLLTDIRFESQGNRYVMGIGLDITDRKRAELAERRARDQAEAANRAKDQFIAVLSHELRTPLTPVLAEIEMLQRGQHLTAEDREGLEMIHRNVELETRLIADLLDMTKIMRGELRLELQPMDAHESLRAAVEICRPQIQAQGHQVALNLHASNSNVYADPVRLRQVFWNLVGNAAKYTPQGGQIEIRSCTTPEGRLRIQVVDNGIGMDADTMARLFEPFVQGELTLARRFGGLGLGLSISRALVEAQQGTLIAQSLGKERGSTFTIEFPVISASAAATSAPTRPADIPVRPGRILLVEDNPDTLRVMTLLLRRFGHEVQSAASVKDALELSEKWQFDLLLSDIGLPDGTGWDLMRQLSARRPTRGMAFSGFVSEEDIQRSRTAGFVEHLSKPVDVQHLNRAIAQAMA